MIVIITLFYSSLGLFVSTNRPHVLVMLMLISTCRDVDVDIMVLVMLISTLQRMIDKPDYRVRKISFKISVAAKNISHKLVMMTWQGCYNRLNSYQLSVYVCEVSRKI